MRNIERICSRNLLDDHVIRGIFSAINYTLWHVYDIVAKLCEREAAFKKCIFAKLSL